MVVVEQGEFKGNKLIILKRTAEDNFPFQFGLGKAKLILLPPMPDWLKNVVKSIYLTGFSVILALVFTLIEYLMLGSNNSERMFGYYMISQMIVSFAFLNKNIKIDKIDW